MKILSYSYVKYTSRVSFIHLTVQKSKCKNLDFVFLFPYILPVSFFFSLIITQKVYSVYEKSTHQTTAQVSEICLFLVRAACDQISTSYDLKMCHSGFSIWHFMCNYMHNLKTKGRIRTFYLWNDCSTIGDIYSLG